MNYNFDNHKIFKPSEMGVAKITILALVAIVVCYTQAASIEMVNFQGWFRNPEGFTVPKRSFLMRVPVLG